MLVHARGAAITMSWSPAIKSAGTFTVTPANAAISSQLRSRLR